MIAVVRVLLGLSMLAALLPAADFALQRLTAESLYEEAQKEKGLEKLVITKQAIALAPQSYSYQRYRSSVEKRLRRPLSHREAVKHAISLRPSWPYIWQELLESYAAAGEFSPEFDAALQRVHVLGYDSNDQVLRRVMLAFDVLDRVPNEESRQLLRKDIYRVYRSNRKWILGYALLNGKVDFICRQGLQETDPQLLLWCEQTPKFVSLCMNNKPQTQRLQNYCDKWLRYWRGKVYGRFRLLPDDYSPPSDNEA